MLLAVALTLSNCGRDRTPPTPTVVAHSPTFTSTPGADNAAARVAASLPVTGSTNTSVTLPATTGPTPTPTQIPTPTATPLPADRLIEGQHQHRYGDYMAARIQFAALLAEPQAEPALRLQARYALARAYLADDAYEEALVTLDLLDQDLAANATLSNTFASKQHFLRADALKDLGRYSEAIAAYERFLASYPGMAEPVQRDIAAAYLAQGDTANAALAYRRAADATTNPVALTTLLEALADTYNNLNRYTDAVAAYDEILAVAKNPDYRASIQLLAGYSYVAAGDIPRAVERWQAATTTAPASNAAYSALIELVNRGVDFDLYQRGYIDLKADAFLPAIDAFQAYLDSVASADSRYGLALHGLGQAQLYAANYSAALETFNAVIANHPTCTCFGQAWIDKAITQLWLGDSVGGRRTFRTFAREHKTDPLAAEALWQSGLQSLRENNPVEAGVDLLALADAFPQSERAPQALYWVGMGAFQTKLYPQTVTTFSRLQQDYPDYNWLAVGYWLGRAHQALGQMDAARSQWQTLVQKAPDVYYGILAAQSLRQTPLTAGNILSNMAAVAGPPSRLPGDDGSQAFAEQWLTTWITPSVGTLSALPAAVADDQDLKMGRILLEVDRRGDALAVLERVFERHKENLPALYPLSMDFERLGAYRLSLLTMQHLLELSPAGLVENAPIFLQKHVYPQPFDKLITGAAQDNQLNPLLYFSLIRQESLFEEGARSVAAAQGLAQIMPATGAEIAERLGDTHYTNALVYRPHVNLSYGAFYLAWARDYLDGNLISALVGYNAGPRQSELWREEFGSDDTIFVEMLDITEPRIYIQTITTNLYHYTRLYGNG